MIWMAWRQFRAQAAAAGAALAAFAILLAITGARLASSYAASGLGSCHGADCRYTAGNFLLGLGRGYPLIYIIGGAGIILAPALIGMFWGAPLVAGELETGTLGLAWTQSVTRQRWLAVKLAMISPVAMVVAEGSSLMLAWWATPIRQASRVATGVDSPFGLAPFGVGFDLHGVTPLGYTAFAFVLGVAMGLAIKRTLPAMALTLAIFAAVQIAFPRAVRPHLFAPLRASIAVDSSGGGVVQHFECEPDAGVAAGPVGCRPATVVFNASELPGQPDAWILASGAVDASGKPLRTMPRACRQAVRIPPGPLRACLAGYGVRIAVTYQPAARYWTFQWSETAIYLAFAVALAGYAFWRIRRLA